MLWTREGAFPLVSSPSISGTKIVCVDCFRAVEERIRQGLPPLDESEVEGNYGVAGAFHLAQLTQARSGASSYNVPLISMSHQGPDDFYEPSISSEGFISQSGARLSTITERTEQTEDPRRWYAAQTSLRTQSSIPTLSSLRAPPMRPSMSSSSTTSYGEIIGACLSP